MNEMIFEGVVVDKTPSVSFTDRNGTMHNECTIMVETEEMYPQRLAIRLLDALCADAPNAGKKVRCYLRCRVSTGNTGKWFNDIKAWRIAA